LKQIFPEKEYRGLSPNFHIHVSVSELYIPTMGLPVLLEEICRLILGIYKSLKDTMNVEIGAEAALFPEKEYINGIAVAVHGSQRVEFGSSMRNGERAGECSVRKNVKFILRKKEEICRMLREQNFAAQCEMEREL
jgi:hypothetical protein